MSSNLNSRSTDARLALNNSNNPRFSNATFYDRIELIVRKNSTKCENHKTSTVISDNPERTDGSKSGIVL